MLPEDTMSYTGYEMGGPYDTSYDPYEEYMYQQSEPYSHFGSEMYPQPYGDPYDFEAYAFSKGRGKRFAPRVAQGRSHGAPSIPRGALSAFSYGRDQEMKRSRDEIPCWDGTTLTFRTFISQVRWWVAGLPDKDKSTAVARLLPRPLQPSASWPIPCQNPPPIA